MTQPSTLETIRANLAAGQPVSDSDVRALVAEVDRLRQRQIAKHNIDTLMLCIAGAWLYGTISGGRARELAGGLGRTAEDVEKLKFVEERETERFLPEPPR